MKNQKGFSLLEVTIAMGLATAAGAAYMTHVQNVAKNESKQKVRASLSQLEAQASDYLRARDICNSNTVDAFRGVDIVGRSAVSYTHLRAHETDSYLVC